MFFSNNSLRIGLIALLATTSSLFAQTDPVNPVNLSAKSQLSSGSYSKDLYVEWRPVETTLDFKALATMTLFNNDTSKSLSGGTVVDGVFQPGWKIYFNQPYEPGPGENRFTVAPSDKTLYYFVMTPTENFGTIPPGGNVTLSMQSGFENAVIFALSKFTKSGSAVGLHISYNDSEFAHFIPIKTIVDIDNPAVMSRLPLALANFGIVDTVPADTPVTRYPNGVPDLNVPIQKRIIPNPTYVAETADTFDVSSIGSVHAQSGLNFEKRYLKKLLKALPGNSGSSDIYLKIATQLIPNLPATANGQNAPESYMINVKNDEIEIIGADAAGVFYGIQTLRQLIFQAQLSGSNTIPVMTISDAPRFELRGNLLDVGRQFIPKKNLLKYIDLLSMFKINRFQMHLTENEGWRLEIPGIPELTAYGRRRTFNPAELRSLSPAFGTTVGLGGGDRILNKPDTLLEANFGVEPRWQGFEDALNNFYGGEAGYYSTDDLVHIIRYAANRHVEIQLAVSMPSHARAAIMAMEARYRKYAQTNPTKASEYRLINPLDASPNASNVVNPCLPSTYAFLEKVVKEVNKIYRRAGVEFKTFHIGGDEVPGISDNTTWPLCQATQTSAELLDQFMTRYTEIVSAYGAKVDTWAETMEYELTAPNKPLRDLGVATQIWNNFTGSPPPGQVYDFANNDFPVVLSQASNLYLDMLQSKHPNEVGLTYSQLIGTKEVFGFVPENYIISYMTTNIFGEQANILGGNFGQVIDPVALSRSQTALNPQKISNIRGIEIALWGEFRKTYPNTEYMVFPRILAAAERSWNQNPPVSGFVDLNQSDADLLNNILTLRGQIDQAWLVFANSIGKYALPMLDYYPKIRPTTHNINPVNYRIQPAGAIIQGGNLLMNSMMPGLTLQYSLDQGTTWNNWTGSVPVTGPVQVRTINRLGESSWVETVSP